VKSNADPNAIVAQMPLSPNVPGVPLTVTSSHSIKKQTQKIGNEDRMCYPKVKAAQNSDKIRKVERPTVVQSADRIWPDAFS